MGNNISYDYGIIIPVRGGSVRIPRKNALPFGTASSLLEWKINQLSEHFAKDRIYVSTEDDEFKEIALRLNVNVHDRNPLLSKEREVSFHDVLHGVVSDIPHQHIAWCLVTSPLMAPKEYLECFEAYETHVINGAYDSLISMNHLKEYLWNDQGPFNYKLNQHVPSQQLPDIYKVTNAIHMRPKKDIVQKRYYIGPNAYKQILPKLAGIDIDEMEDYMIAQALYPLYQQQLMEDIAKAS